MFCQQEIPTDVWISMIHERLKSSDCIRKVSVQYLKIRFFCSICLKYNLLYRKVIK